MRRRLRRRSTKSTAGAVRALALFAILCGALLLAVSFNSVEDAESRPVEEAPTGPDRADIEKALEHLERARSALDSTDYGQVRFHLLESKYTLRRSVETN
jgi:hypothetical protein